LGTGFAGKIAASGEPGMVLDTSNQSDPFTPAVRTRAKSLWGVPLKVEGQATGVLLIGFPKPYEWLPTERDLMRAIGDRTALAIERAHDRRSPPARTEDRRAFRALVARAGRGT